MIQRRARYGVVAWIAAAAMVGGCGTTTVASGSPATQPPPPGSLTPTPSVEATSPSSTASPSVPVPPSLTPEPVPTPPPDATLRVEGGDPVVGELGSWSWLNAGSDAPYLPGNPIHVGAEERMVFAMTVPIAIDAWQVARVPPTSIPGDEGRVGIAQGTGDTIWFEAPPAGTWAVSVSVWFANNLGSAAYYWQVEVD